MKQSETRRAAVHRVLPFLCFLPVYLGLRAVFLHDALGYRYGSNGAWRFRFWGSIAGYLSRSIANTGIVALCFTAVILVSVGWCAFLMRRGMRFTPQSFKQMPLSDLLKLFAGPLVAVVAASLVIAFSTMQTNQHGFDLPQAAVELFLPQFMMSGLGAALWVLCAGRALWKSFRFGVFCYAWGLFTLVLISFSPSPLHRYYLMNAGFALLISGGMLLWIAPLAERFRSLWD